MKIGIVADLHLNKGVYLRILDKRMPTLPFRNVDFMLAFENSIDEMITNIKPDLVIIAGDVYDHYNPSNEVRGFFSLQLSKLSAAKIPVIILIGNHDVCKRHHAVKDIHELKLKNIIVVESPMVTSFKGMNLFLFPYSLDIEQKNKTIRQEFEEFLIKIKEKPKSETSMFVGHFGVKGAILNEYCDDVVIDNNGDFKSDKKDFYDDHSDISVDDLDRTGADYVILGDYHKFQILNTKKCVAMYTGSLEKNNFSEIDQKKGFVVYDDSVKPTKDMGHCGFIEYKNCRPMLELKGGFSDIKKLFNNINAEKYIGAIVKINFVGNNQEVIDFSVNIEDFKKELTEKINPVHIEVVQKVTNDEQDKEATKLEKEIMEKGHFTNEDIIGVVKEIIDEQVKDDAERQLTCDLAIEIYKETMEK